MTEISTVWAHPWSDRPRILRLVDRRLSQGERIILPPSTVSAYAGPSCHCDAEPNRLVAAADSSGDSMSNTPQDDHAKSESIRLQGLLSRFARLPLPFLVS